MTGGADLPWNTRVSGDVAYGWMRQNQNYLPYTVNPLLADPIPIPRGDADAGIDTTAATLRIASRPIDRLRIDANVRYDDRDNTTPRNVYQYVAGDSLDQQGLSATRRASTCRTRINSWRAASKPATRSSTARKSRVALPAPGHQPHLHGGRRDGREHLRGRIAKPAALVAADAHRGWLLRSQRLRVHVPVAALPGLHARAHRDDPARRISSRTTRCCARTTTPIASAAGARPRRPDAARDALDRLRHRLGRGRLRPVDARTHASAKRSARRPISRGRRSRS